MLAPLLTPQGGNLVSVHGQLLEHVCDEYHGTGSEQNIRAEELQQRVQDYVECVAYLFIYLFIYCGLLQVIKNKA